MMSGQAKKKATNTLQTAGKGNQNTNQTLGVEGSSVLAPDVARHVNSIYTKIRKIRGLETDKPPKPINWTNIEEELTYIDIEYEQSIEYKRAFESIKNAFNKTELKAGNEEKHKKGGPAPNPPKNKQTTSTPSSSSNGRRKKPEAPQTPVDEVVTEIKDNVKKIAAFEKERSDQLNSLKEIKENLHKNEKNSGDNTKGNSKSNDKDNQSKVKQPQQKQEKISISTDENDELIRFIGQATKRMSVEIKELRRVIDEIHSTVIDAKSGATTVENSNKGNGNQSVSSGQQHPILQDLKAYINSQTERNQEKEERKRKDTLAQINNRDRVERYSIQEKELIKMIKQKLPDLYSTKKQWKDKDDFFANLCSEVITKASQNKDMSEDLSACKETIRQMESFLVEIDTQWTKRDGTEKLINNCKQIMKKWKIGEMHHREYQNAFVAIKEMLKKDMFKADENSKETPKKKDSKADKAQKGSKPNPGHENSNHEEIQDVQHIQDDIQDLVKRHQEITSEFASFKQNVFQRISESTVNANSKKSEQKRKNQPNTGSIEEFENLLQQADSAKQERQEKMLQEIDKLKAENESLQTRLSKVAGTKLAEGNPSITNLSDPNRPMRLAEMYTELYDNEWTDVMDKAQKIPEDKILQSLCETVLGCYNFCMSKNGEIDKQLSDDVRQITKTLEIDAHNVKEILSEVKTYGKLLTDGTCKKYFQEMKKNHKQTLKDFKITTDAMTVILSSSFFEKCFNLCWKMVLQSPPMVLEVGPESGKTFDKTKFREYTSSGTKVVLTVWPALLLDKGGPLLVKGVLKVK